MTVFVPSLTYDGKVLTTIDAKYNVTTFVYDGKGELIRKTDAKENTSAFYYDLGGRKIAEVAPNDYVSAKDLSLMNRTEYSYDLMGRLLTIKSVYFDTIANAWKNIVTKAYAYDANGNITKELDALGYSSGTGSTVLAIINSGYGTVTTYNLANKPVTVQDPDTKDRSLAYTVSYSYDGEGRKVSETNAKGVVTTYYYDDSGSILKTTVKKTTAGVEKIIKSATYDGVGNVKTATDGNGNVKNYDYNALNGVKAVTYAGDSTIATDTVTYQYDVMGNLKWQGNFLGKVNIYTYDNQGSVITSTEKALDDSNPISTSIKYDVNGNKRYVTDGKLVTTENIYDELNRLISTSVTVNSVKQTTSYGYDANSNKTSVTDWRGNVTQYVYDPLSRLSKKIDAYGKSIETLEYYDNGAQSKSTDALNNVTQYFYDKNKRLIKTIDPENKTTSQTYDAVGNISSKTDGDLNVTNYTFDEFNNLLTVKNAKNETTSYTFDLNKNMLSQTDGKLNTSNYEYNAANKMARRIDNGGRIGVASSYIYDPAKTESYTYYANGSLKSKTDRNGLVTNYTYDVHGRKLIEAVGTINLSYTYDNNGNQLSITNATGTTTRTYDELNSVTSKDVPSIGKSTYVYDIITGMDAGTFGELTTDPKGNVTLKVYDKTGRLWKVSVDGKTTTYNYFDNGSRQSVVYPDGSKEVYTYYKDNLTKTLTNIKADGTIIDSYAYTYDGNRSMLTKVDGKGTTSYVYDVLNRLQKVTEPGSGKITSYTYDAAGNRLSETVIAAGITTINTYTCNDQNRLLNVSTKVNGVAKDSTDYTYDNNGSQKTTKVNGTITVTNTYDELNQLISTVAAGTTVTNGYNGEGLRTSKAVNGVVTKYLYEYDKVVLEVDGSGTETARNVYGTNLLTRIVGSDTLYYMYNGHADVTALVDTNKVVRATYYYDAFGNPLETKFYDAGGILTANGVNNPITFAGYQYDAETGLYYLNARMYDPKIASFLQEDSYRGEANDPLSLNLYAYCSNEPLMYSDPTGHWKWLDKATSAVGNAIDSGISNVKSAASSAWDGIKSGADAALSFTSSAVGETFNNLAYKPLYSVGKLAGKIENKTFGTSHISKATESFKKNNIDVTVDWFNSLGSNKKAHDVGKIAGAITGQGMQMMAIGGAIGKALGVAPKAGTVVQNGVLNFGSGSISTALNGYADGKSGNQILHDSAMTGLISSGIGAGFDSIPYLSKGLSNAVSNMNNTGLQPAFATSGGGNVNGFKAFNDAVGQFSKPFTNEGGSAYSYMASNGGGNSAKGINNSKTGSYTIEFESGMKYHGKGPASRMEKSALEKSTKYNDPVKSKDWTPAQNSRDAFKEEYKRMQTDPNGYKDNNNYNKRQSPGKKYYEQDLK